MNVAVPDRMTGSQSGSAPDGTLYLELDGWAGPLDLLLDLARRQKVDLRNISVLALADQYLAYIGRAEALRLELAADYLVMAAWLAYLKSSLLLPREEQEEPSAEELALRLQLRLQRLAAMREAAARLMARDRVGRDVFLRPAPEGLRIEHRTLWRCELFDIYRAYGQVKARATPVVHRVAERLVMSLEQALERMSAMLAASLDWTRLEAFLPLYAGEEQSRALRRSALASSFAAALELARTGRVKVRQDRPFGPLQLRPVRG